MHHLMTARLNRIVYMDYFKYPHTAHITAMMLRAWGQEVTVKAKYKPIKLKQYKHPRINIREGRIEVYYE